MANSSGKQDPSQELEREGDDGEEVLDVLDLPQIHTKPSSKQLLETLSLLSLAPPSWETTPSLTPTGSNTPRSRSGANTPLRSKPKVRSQGVPQYLTTIISSPLAWISDPEKEEVWDAASLRLSERSGRTGMGAISRSFRIPVTSEPTNKSSTMKPVITTSQDQDTALEIDIHEPALTEDNLGLKTWASSFVFARNWHLLSDNFPLVFGKDQDKGKSTILELGAGTGLVGIAAAAVLGANVLLTDLPEIVSNLQRNIDSNKETIDSRGGSAHAAILDWSTPEKVVYADDTEEESSTYPLIVAADPIYTKEQPAWLVQTIDCHLSRGSDARVIIQLPIREAYVEERADLKNRLQTLGLDMCHEHTEIGYDDWSDGQGEELSEVECWLGIWKWKDA